MKLKGILRLIAFTLFGAVLGAAAGMAGANFNSDIRALLAALQSGLVKYSFWLMNGTAVVFLALGLWFSAKAKSLYQQDSFADDEQAFEQANTLLGRALVCTYVLTAALFAFIGLLAADVDGASTLALVGIIEAVLLLYLLTALQGRIITQSKVLFPEKQGDIYAASFQRQWLASCDEAERLEIYRAGYAAFGFMQKFLLLCWIVAMLAMLFLDGSLWTVLLISVIWGAQTLAYSRAALRGGR